MKFYEITWNSMKFQSMPISSNLNQINEIPPCPGGRLVGSRHMAGWWVFYTFIPEIVSDTIWGGCINYFKWPKWYLVPKNGHFTKKFFKLGKKLKKFSKNFWEFSKKLKNPWQIFGKFLKTFEIFLIFLLLKNSCKIWFCWFMGTNGLALLIPIIL